MPGDDLKDHATSSHDFYALLGVSHPFDPTSRLFTSWLLPPYVLASLRLLFSLYAFTTTFTVFGWNDAHGLASASRRGRRTR